VLAFVKFKEGASLTVECLVHNLMEKMFMNLLVISDVASQFKKTGNSSFSTKKTTSFLHAFMYSLLFDRSSLNDNCLVMLSKMLYPRLMYLGDSKVSPLHL